MSVRMGADVQVGDGLVSMGEAHTVRALEPYDTSAYTWGQPGTRIARGDNGWSMTLFPTQAFLVSDL